MYLCLYVVKKKNLCGTKRKDMLTKKYLDKLTYEIIGCAIEVHKIMGSGLLENVYHQCMK